MRILATGNPKKQFSLIDYFRPGNPWWAAMRALPGFSGSAVQLLAASLAINLLSMAMPLTMMQVYDRIVAYEAKTTLSWLVIGCTVAVLMENMLHLARFHVTGWMAAKFDHMVGCSAMHRLLSAPLPVFERVGVGVRLEEFYAVNTLRGFYSGQIFQILLDLPFSVLFIATVAVLGGMLGVVTLVMVAALVLFFILLKNHFARHRKRQVDLNDRRFNFVIEVLTGIHLVKSQAIEEQMLRRYESLQSSMADNNMRVALWSALPIHTGVLFSQAMMFILIAVGGPSVMDGSMTLGTLTACTMLAGRALQPIQMAAGFWLRFSDADIAREQLGHIAVMPPDVEADAPLFPPDIQGAVRVQGITFRYREDLEPVVQDVSLDVEPRQMVGIRSGSASGVTTLCYLIRGMLTPESGQVYIDDYDLNEWDHSRLRGRVEYVPQSGVIFSGTILDNITMFDSSKRQAALDAAVLIGLDQLVSALPQGYESVVTTQAGVTMPTGLIQRISLVRAFVMRPRVLIFDNADASLDQSGERAFLDFFSHLKGQCTVVLCTRNEFLLKLCDVRYAMEQRTLVPDRGEPEQPVSSRDVFQGIDFDDDMTFV
jgi:ATP-binding cassette subfamily C protein LapB